MPRSPTGPCMGSIPYFSLILLNLETRYWMINGNNCFWVELSRGGDSLVAQKEKKNLPSMQETRVRKIPWRREWQPTPVFLPGESHGQRSMVGYTSWGHRESDMTEQHTHTHTHIRGTWVWGNSSFNPHFGFIFPQIFQGME